ncbi:outer membrane protein [Aestuariibius insulae]|uniref:outer membrane protein n=1 Tax=Aestuariibius insulae TaxID=2058287 RepID=UPI00345EBA5C
MRIQTRRLTTLTAMVTLMSAPVFAGGLVEPAPEPIIAAPVPVAPVAPIWDFSGAYVGAGLGSGTFTADGDDEDIQDEAELLFENFDDDDTAGAYQIHGGYNFVNNNFVYGPEVALFFGESEIGAEATDGADADAEINFGARVMGRAGYQLGRTMLYGTAGLAYLDIEADDEDVSDTGIAFGAGADFLVTERIMLGVEYMQHDFNEFDDTDADVDYQTVSARLSYRF